MPSSNLNDDIVLFLNRAFVENSLLMSKSKIFISAIYLPLSLLGLFFTHGDQVVRVMLLISSASFLVALIVTLRTFFTAEQGIDELLAGNAEKAANMNESVKKSLKAVFFVIAIGLTFLLFSVVLITASKGVL